MNKQTTGYIPANMPGGPTMNNTCKFNDKIIGWWNKNCLFYYPKLLISAYHLLNSKKTLKIDNYNDLKDYFNIEDDRFLIMDSGGFSMSTLGDIDIKPQQIIDLSTTFNADIMMSLDLPPYNLLDESKPFSLPISEFNIKMEKSYENAKYMSENLDKFNGKYYICVHGDSFDRLDLWFDKHKELKCDGYALAPKDKSNFWKLARTLVWIYNKGIRENIHFLAFSGINTIPVLVYFSKYIDNLTYDSSSWAGGAIRREYCLPFLKQKIIYGNSTNHNIDLYCNCEICCKMNEMNDFNNDNGGALMSMHNLLKYDEMEKLLYSFVNDKILFNDVIKTYFNKKLLDVFEYIDFGIEHGFELAEKRFSYKFSDEILNTSQPTIFSF